MTTSTLTEQRNDQRGPIDTVRPMTPIDDVHDIARLLPGALPSVEHISTRGTGAMASAFDVPRLLGSTALHFVAAADGLAGRTSSRGIDLDQVAAFCTTHVDIDGEPLPAWADLSGVYPTADGRHLQLHCNFAHHATGVTELLGTPDDRADGRGRDRRT